MIIIVWSYENAISPYVKLPLNTVAGLRCSELPKSLNLWSRMTLSFWFDFASTYSYPAAMRIEQLAQELGVPLSWNAFLLSRIFRHRAGATRHLTCTRSRGVTCGVIWSASAKRNNCHSAGHRSFRATGYSQRESPAVFQRKTGFRLLFGRCIMPISPKIKTSPTVV